MVVIKEYPDGLVVRTAHAPDKQAVLGISVFGDLDYLKAMYDHYVENPQFSLYLAELKGHVVAFCYTYLVDDDTTVIWGGKRVHEEYRGRGYLTKLSNPVEDYVAKQYPHITTWRYAAQWDHFQKQHMPKLRQAGALQKLVLRGIQCFDASLASMRSLIQQERFQQLCTEYDVSKVTTAPGPNTPPAALLDKATQHDLFPDDIVIVFWEPYRPLPSNFRYIMQTSRCNTTYSDDGRLVAVSFISEIETFGGTLRLDLESYVSSSLPADERRIYFRQHILKFLHERGTLHGDPAKAVKDSVNEALSFFFPKEFDIEETKSFITDAFPSCISSQRSFHTELDPLYMACDYDRTKMLQLDTT